MTTTSDADSVDVDKPEVAVCAGKGTASLTGTFLAVDIAGVLG